MPTHRTRIAHTFGRAAALARLRAFTEWARSNSDLNGTWEGNNFTFTLSIQGIRLGGTMQVQEDCVELTSEVPAVATMFADQVPELVRMALTSRGPSLGTVPEASAAASPEVDPGPAVLFLHIPKAAGQSLAEYILRQYGVEGYQDRAGIFRDGVLSLTYGFFKDGDLAVPEYVRPLLARPDLRAVIGHFTFGIHEHVARPSTYITVLREPVDRVVSLYYYLELQNRMTLEEFAASPPFREIDNDQTRRIAGVDPEIGTLTRATLETARENLRRHFSVMGTLERFEETLVLLNRRLGWARGVPSTWQNVTKQRKHVTAIPESALEAIRRRNELDLELYRFVTDWMDGAIEEEGPGFHEEMAGRAAQVAAGPG